MKKIIFPIILSITTIYMLFIYEPIVMFASNTSDFWFDLYTILPSLILITIISSIILSIFYIGLYKICQKKQKKVFEKISIIHFIIFFILYINGNYLAKSLKILDGTKFTIKFLSIDTLISVLVIISTVVTVTICLKKLKEEKTIKIFNYLTIVIFIMLTSGLVYTLINNPKSLEKKDYVAIATNKNINTYSKDKNLIIFVVDGADARVFEKARTSSKYKNAFTDFTYYPDTMATYGNTNNSVPFILTGMWDEKKEDFNTYSKNAYKKSKLFKTLHRQKYNMNIYEESFEMGYDESKKILNFYHKHNKNINQKKFFKEELKYIKYKYLPYFLKETSDINSFKLSASRIGNIDKKNEKYGYYSWYNVEFYNNILNNKLKLVDNKQFKFIHIEGPHLPFNMDDEMNIIGEGTYEQKNKATIKLLDSYLNQLKEQKVYDNSIIIILADHGLSEREDFKGRQNPLLLIKGIDEHHKYKTSDKPISFEDLQEAYQELLNDKNSTEIFKDIANKRKRRFLFYPDQFSNELIEYYQTDKAWKLDTMKKTGKTYKLKENKNAS